MPRPDRRWITPASQPQAGRCIQVTIPDAPEYVAILRGIALDLANPANWQQLQGIAACDAAAWAELILTSLESVTPC